MKPETTATLLERTSVAKNKDFSPDDLVDDPEPQPAAPPPESYQQFGALITALVEGMKGIAMTPEAMKAILLETGAVNAELAKKARWPENPDHPHISAYFTEADRQRYGDHTQKPKLKRETFFCGVREDEERLSVAEIEAYNAFNIPNEVRGGAWRAVIKKPTAVGGKEELWIWVPKDTVDQRMMLPSLFLVLHELNGGPSTENVADLINQITQLKAMLAAAKHKTVLELEQELIGQ